MPKWTQNSDDILHYTKIAHEFLKAMTGLPPYLMVRLRNRTTVHGWLKSSMQGNNAAQNTPPFPTSWYGSLTLQDGAQEIEIDYLDIETVYSRSPPP